MRVVEIPHQDESLQAQCFFYVKQEGHINTLPLIRQPVVDHKVSFIGLVSRETGCFLICLFPDSILPGLYCMCLRYLWIMCAWKCPQVCPLWTWMKIYQGN